VSGYRESSFDPNASDYGPPLRPFNRWQWIGAGIGGMGILIMLAALAGGFFHLIRADTKDWLPMGTSFCALGTVLISSRRQPGRLRSETTRKRMVILAVGLMVFAAALITILLIKGA
jgi:drug/metabolite transporter (DMT)-like permease